MAVLKKGSKSGPVVGPAIPAAPPQIPAAPAPIVEPPQVAPTPAPAPSALAPAPGVTHAPSYPPPTFSPSAPGAPMSMRSDVATVLGPVPPAAAPISSPPSAVFHAPDDHVSAVIVLDIVPHSGSSLGKGTAVPVGESKLLDLNVKVALSGRKFDISIDDGTDSTELSIGSSGGYTAVKGVTIGGKDHTLCFVSYKEEVHAFAIEDGAVASNATLDPHESAFLAPSIVVYSFGPNNEGKTQAFVLSKVPKESKVYLIEDGHPQDVEVTTQARVAKSLHLEVSFNSLVCDLRDVVPVAAVPALPVVNSDGLLSTPAVGAPPIPLSNPKSTAAPSASATSASSGYTTAGPLARTVHLPEPKARSYKTYATLDQMRSAGCTLSKGQSVDVSVGSNHFSIALEENGLLSVSDGKKNQTANSNGETTITILGRVITIKSEYSAETATVTITNVALAPRPPKGPSVAQRLMPTPAQAISLTTAAIGLVEAGTGFASGSAIFSSGTSVAIAVGLGMAYCISKLLEKPEVSK
ncbi:MAG: hypothetical protein ACP5N9_03525 [Candidatus Bilamarchaeum sp.]